MKLYFHLFFVVIEEIQHIVKKILESVFSIEALTILIESLCAYLPQFHASCDYLKI